MTLYIIIYVISAIGTYIWVHKTHSKGGSFDSINPSFADLIFTFLPILNTGFALIYFCGWVIYKIDKIFHSSDSLSKFFRIKK